MGIGLPPQVALPRGRGPGKVRPAGGVPVRGAGAGATARVGKAGQNLRAACAPRLPGMKTCRA